MLLMGTCNHSYDIYTLYNVYTIYNIHAIYGINLHDLWFLHNLHDAIVCYQTGSMDLEVS